jgi:cysteine-rich repeat protein
MRAALASFRCSFFVAVLTAVLVGAPDHVGAQLTEIPAFLAIDRTQDVNFGSYSFAPGADSSVLVLASTWTSDINKSRKVVQLFGPTGTPIGGLVRVDDPDHEPHLAQLIADGHGGFVATWRLGGPFGLPMAGRTLSASGTPTGPDVILSPTTIYGGSAAALADGAVFVWNEINAVRGVLVDAALQPIGSPFTVISYPDFTAFGPQVVAKADGGFVVAWHEGSRLRGRAFDASAVPLGASVELTNEFEATDLAASPLGGFVVVGRRDAETHRLTAGIWGRRFDDDANPMGPAFVIERAETPFFVYPAADFDAAGHLYVVWPIFTATPGARGRFYDTAGKAMQDAFRIADDFVSGLQVVARPDGRFVEGWTASGGDLMLQVRGLCVPPDHTGCGNGVLEAPCERCDDGAANDDAAPDACRTNCMPATCGDGVVDHDEQCDDGNLVGCDGCDADCHLEVGWLCGDGVVSADCEEECDDGPGNDDTLPNACRTDCRAAHCSDGVVDDGEPCDDGNLTSCDGCSDHCVPEPGLVCGDGIPEVLCGEQCDDANDVVGDGCSAPCQLERIFGGGSPATDCVAEWVVDNPTNVPLVDAKRGGFNGVQVCQDGDPRCDFDTVAGSCAFHVRVCGNNTDVSTCAPRADQRIRSWELRVPSESKAAKRPELAAVRAAFATVPGSIVGPAQDDVCSNTLDVVVPTKAVATGAKPGSVVLKSYATLYTGEKDTDKLKLVCRP